IEEITNTLTEFKSKLKYEATLVDKDYWRLLDIRAGIGEIQAGSEAMFIPQMLNFNERGGISYDKGCYTGQEIIARMQYRGNLKRHLLYLHSDTANTAPAVGQALYNGQKEQAIGYIVDALLSSKGIEALAVCTDESADQAVYTETQGGPSYRAQTLSYAIT
ncbi:MAG: tRNA-modifying protein YgfZ, partial [Cellvibrionaceae bacterium]|nr:tRNA-modifying protein YgfZ [Cellvibrionaceae bacterium]